MTGSHIWGLLLTNQNWKLEDKVWRIDCTAWNPWPLTGSETIAVTTSEETWKRPFLLTDLTQFYKICTFDWTPQGWRILNISYHPLSRLLKSSCYSNLWFHNCKMKPNEGNTNTNTFSKLKFDFQSHYKGLLKHFIYNKISI